MRLTSNGRDLLPDNLQAAWVLGGYFGNHDVLFGNHEGPVGSTQSIKPHSLRLQVICSVRVEWDGSEAPVKGDGFGQLDDSQVVYLQIEKKLQSNHIRIKINFQDTEAFQCKVAQDMFATPSMKLVIMCSQTALMCHYEAHRWRCECIAVHGHIIHTTRYITTTGFDCTTLPKSRYKR